MKASQLDYFKATQKTTKYGLIPLVAFYVSLWWYMDSSKVFDYFILDLAILISLSYTKSTF